VDGTRCAEQAAMRRAFKTFFDDIGAHKTIS